MLPVDRLTALRHRFLDLDYTVAGVVDAVGEAAHAGLGRNSTLPAVRALAGRKDPLATLTLLWPLQAAVARDDLDRALPGAVEPLLAAGVLTAGGDEVRAAVDIRPYEADEEPIWIVSDLTPGLDTVLRPIRPDFVLGVSSASSTLAQLVPRRRVDRALDLGTGCGVQSVHLARHAAAVVGTDVNPRALALARLTLPLNGVVADLRAGSLYEPVAGERYDLVVSNPPYVMAPPREPNSRLTYREGGFPADGLVEHLVRHAGAVLADGGTCVLLANWAHLRGVDWAERVAGWVPAGCDAHVVQREVLEPYAYVELWLADAGLAGGADYLPRYTEWLGYLDALGVEAVGMGWLVLHRTGRADPWVRVEDWPHPVEQPIAPALEAERAAVARLHALSDAELLGTRWTLAGDVAEEPPVVPGPPTPSTSCCAPSAASVARSRSTPGGRGGRGLRRRPAAGPADRHRRRPAGRRARRADRRPGAADPAADRRRHARLSTPERSSGVSVARVHSDTWRRGATVDTGPRVGGPGLGRVATTCSESDPKGNSGTGEGQWPAERTGRPADGW